MRGTRAVVIACLIGAAVVGGSPPAGAAPPSRSSYSIPLELEASTCPFPVHLSVILPIRDTIYTDATGTPVREFLHVAAYGTDTDPATGISLIRKDVDNIWIDLRTRESRDIGLPSHVRLPNGRTVLIDAGNLRFGADGSVVFEAGHHQSSDGDTAAYCAALSGTL